MDAHSCSRLPDGSVQMNLTDTVYSYPGGPMRYPNDPNEKPKYPTPGELLIHELTHAWQLARDRNMYLWLEEISRSEYDPLPAGSPWQDNNIEQQATIVNQWFRKQACESVTKKKLNRQHSDRYRLLDDEAAPRGDINIRAKAEAAGGRTVPSGPLFPVHREQCPRRAELKRYRRDRPICEE